MLMCTCVQVGVSTHVRSTLEAHHHLHTLSSHAAPHPSGCSSTPRPCSATPQHPGQGRHTTVCAAAHHSRTALCHRTCQGHHGAAHGVEQQVLAHIKLQLHVPNAEGWYAALLPLSQVQSTREQFLGVLLRQQVMRAGAHFSGGLHGVLPLRLPGQRSRPALQLSQRGCPGARQQEGKAAALQLLPAPELQRQQAADRGGGQVGRHEEDGGQQGGDALG